MSNAIYFNLNVTENQFKQARKELLAEQIKFKNMDNYLKRKNL